MKFVLAFVVFAALSAGALAAVIATPPYQPCPQGFVLSNGPQPLRDAANFEANLLHYNKVNLMSGNPIGPWFDIDPSQPCTWLPQGALSCKLRVYANVAKTVLLGSATISSPNFALLNDAYNSTGGYLTYIQTTIAAVANTFPNTAEYSNYRDMNTLLYFQPQPVYPLPPDSPIANRLEFIEGRLYITLWGSSGYNAATGQFETAGQGTGMDLRFPITCPDNPPPIIPGCPCDDPAAVFSVNFGCVQNGVAISRSGNGCVQLSFANAPCLA